jgi:hypothetical protein
LSLSEADRDQSRHDDHSTPDPEQAREHTADHSDTDPDEDFADATHTASLSALAGRA